MIYTLPEIHMIYEDEHLIIFPVRYHHIMKLRTSFIPYQRFFSSFQGDFKVFSHRKFTMARPLVPLKCAQLRGVRGKEFVEKTGTETCTAGVRQHII